MTNLPNNTLSTTAMVLAAGHGTRMRPLTLTKPKPLFEVGGRSMLDLAIDKLRDAGITRVVVNCFYLADHIIEHLALRCDVDIVISRETELLDTGGGIKNALHYFDGKPFFALNADLPWMDDASAPSIPAMMQAWDARKMDALLLLMPTARAKGFSAAGVPARGDFMMDADGKVHRHDAKPPYPYVLISAQILKPDYFAATPEKIFSNNVVWDKAEREGRLYGVEHKGTCFHVGTPQDWAQANTLLKNGVGWG